MHHELKIWPEYYEAVKNGSKTFEVRNNDRDYRCGDTIKMYEFNPSVVVEPGVYTGRETEIFKVGYVLPLDKDVVVFSLLPIEKEIK